MNAVSVASPAEFLAALAGAKRIELAAYTLGDGPVLRGLEAAAGRGADVVVRLEGSPFHHSRGLRAQNRRVAEALARHGATAILSSSRERPLHLKAAVIDGVAYLDDRNWASGDAETIVRDERPEDVGAVSAAMKRDGGRPCEVALEKGDALEREARLLDGAEGPVSIASESFNFSCVYDAVERRLRRGDRVRVLVNERDVRDGERPALKRLEAEGAEVRLGTSSEKLALAGSRAWIGSANATGGKPHTIDWGFASGDPALVATVRARFEANWTAASAL